MPAAAWGRDPRPRLVTLGSLAEPYLGDSSNRKLGRRLVNNPARWLRKRTRLG